MYRIVQKVVEYYKIFGSLTIRRPGQPDQILNLCKTVDGAMIKALRNVALGQQGLFGGVVPQLVAHAAPSVPARAPATDSSSTEAPARGSAAAIRAARGEGPTELSEPTMSAADADQFDWSPEPSDFIPLAGGYGPPLSAGNSPHDCF